MKIATLVIVLLVAGCAPGGERHLEGQASGPDSPAKSPAPPANTATIPGAALHAALHLTRPSPGETVRSPLTVTGEARGPWYFEASFPVKLLDAEGRVLAIAPAQAQGEWMTTSFVPYEVTLTFAAPPAGEGRLVLEKSNASGLPEHSDSVVVPVRF